VLHKVVIKLWRKIIKKKVTFESARHYYNWASWQIRKTLLDLVRHFHGPHGIGANHSTDPSGGNIARQPDSANGPLTVKDWPELDEFIEGLPENQKELFKLRWYHGLSNEEIAKVMSVSVRTVKRWWLAIRLAIARRFGGKLSVE